MPPKQTKLVLKNDNVIVSLPETASTTAKPLVITSSGQMAIGIGFGGGSTTFDGDRPITRGIPGLQGVTAGGDDVVEFLNKVFFVDVAPGASLQTSNSVREMGSPVGVTLSWSVQAQTNPITAITVNNLSQSITLTSGTVTASTAPNVDTTFSMTVQTENESVSAQAGVQYRHYRYWITSEENFFTYSDVDISDMLWNVGTREFSTGRQQTRDFSLNNQYIYFVYPASFGEASFIVGGLPNTAYTYRDFLHTNQQGFTETFRIYRSGGRGTGGIQVQVQ